MIVFIAHRVDDPLGEQFLITVLDSGGAMISTRATNDPAEQWSQPRPLSEVTAQ